MDILQDTRLTNREAAEWKKGLSPSGWKATPHPT